MDVLTSFFARNGFLPHGYCFTWSPGLLWAMVGADALIAAAYFSIPLAIISFVRKRAPQGQPWLPWLFSAFIFACGITHLMDIWTIWQPDYAAQMVAKVVTAGISITTAVALWPLIPKALSLPSVQQLQSAIARLEAEGRMRKSVQDHLFVTEQRLSVTLASIGAGFIATDSEGRVTAMNAVAEHVTGWPQHEAHGQMLWTVLQREDRPAEMQARNPVDVVLEQGITIDLPFHVVAIARDGKRTPLEVKVALTHGDDGKLRGLAVVFRDLTQINRTEAELRRLAAIVESSNDAIISKTLDGQITSWNHAAQRMFGYTAEEAIGQSVQMLLPADRQAEEMRILADLAHGHNVPAFDTQRRAKDGSLVDVSVSISPIRDAAGRIVGGSKNARDVSQQRRAEAAFRASDARLRIALDSAQIGEWEMELSTGVTQRSMRHDACFGYQEPLAEWNFDVFLRHVHPDDRQQVMRGFQTAISQAQDWHAESRIVWPDGSLHWISIHGCILQEAGKADRMLGIVSDITAQKLSEESRLKALRLEAENRQIQESNRLKSLFLANMSHELRTPLNAIIGFAELLHSGAVPPQSGKHREFLGHIATSGRHLLQLINDVLDLSKVESGKFEFFPEPVDLTQLVGEVANVLHPSIQHKRLNLVLDIDPTLTGLVLDPARLKQVLYNYLSNAIKFTSEGGRVVARARADGAEYFLLEVEDSGIGIAAADLPRLFVEFQQLDAGYSKRHQGTGLGLALTRRLVEAQGGTVGVSSTPGVGSIFHLRLRRVFIDGAAAAVPPSPRLLVIDADPQLQSRITLALSQAGIQVDTATTAKQAFDHAHEHAYDALTLGLMLSDDTGLRALASIRSDGASRLAPVVAVTLAADAGEPATFTIANVLCKPIRTEEVVTAMARLRLPGAQRARVMVIDDDPLALDLMRATLAGMGIDAVCLLDGRQALHDISEHRPDAIILDLMMPEFDGFAVLDALQRLPRWRHTPVFIWTSMLLTDEEYARLARSARAIWSKGGGAVSQMLGELSKWRPPGSVQRNGEPA